MTKINKLTPAQLADIPVFRKKHLDMAQGGPPDRVALTKLMAEAYELIDQPPPQVLILQSPRMAMIAVNFFKNISGRDQLGDQLGDQLRGQPWAWAIIYAGKDIENRSWQAVNHGLKRRGSIAIHAAAGMTKVEYEHAKEFMENIGVICPAPMDLMRGGIVGTATVTDVVIGSQSLWFFGPRGLVLADPQPSEFVPSIGSLGYFKWTASDGSNVPVPAKWMRNHTDARRATILNIAGLE